MPTQAETAFAFVARRAGVRAMPRSRWGHVLAFELGWMNPGQAHAYVEQALACGLLQQDGDDVRLAIDPASVEVPRNFRPDPALPVSGAPPPAVPEDPLLELLDRVAKAQGATRSDIAGRLAALQDRLGGMLDAHAAALAVAQAGGLDVAVDAAAELRRRLAA